MADFYEEKGYTRHMVIMEKETKNILDKIAKTYKITQGEVVDVLAAQDLSNLKSVFEAKRAEKLQKRQEAKQTSMKLKNLTPEQIAEINKVIGK